MPENSPCANARVPMEDLVQTMRQPPCSPEVVPVLRRHLANADAPLGEIVEFIRWDPGVVARVLQTANSALFKRGERCHAIDIAVGRIGFQPVFEIVGDVAAAAASDLSGPLAAYRMPAGDFWRRSLGCGLAAERLAGLRDEDPHVAHALGLFHALGMVAVDRWARFHAPDLMLPGRGFPKEHSESERARLGCAAPEIAAAVLRAWEFPAEICEPVRWQHTPLDAGSHRRLACLLHAARWLAARVAADEAPGRLVAPPEPRCLAPLRISLSELAQEASGVRERLAEARRRLDEENAEIEPALAR